MSSDHIEQAPRTAAELARWREHQTALALACEYTLDLGAQGPAPRAALPTPQGSMLHERASATAAHDGQAPERSEVETLHQS